MSTRWTTDKISALTDPFHLRRDGLDLIEDTIAAGGGGGGGAPSGPAGGDLTGTYPNPGIATGAIVNADVNASAAIAYSKLNLATSVVNADISASAAIAESKLNLASDAAAGVASRRTLGTGATQAAAGNHTHAAPAASAISFTPGGTISSTDVQAAIAEVAAEAGGGGGGSLPFIDLSAAPYSGDLEAAYTALPSTGGTIYAPDGTYTWPSGGWLLQGTKPVRIVGDGAGSTIFQGPSTSNHGLRVRGAVSPYDLNATYIRTLTANATSEPDGSTAYRSRLTMASTTGLAADQWVFLYSSQAWPQTLESTTYGEWVRIRSVVSSTVVELWSNPLYNYTTANAAKIHEWQPMRGFSIEGVTFNNTTVNTGTNGFIFIDGVKSPRVKNCEFKYCDQRGIQVFYSIGGSVRDCEFHDFTDQSNTSPILLGYGISTFNGCEGLIVSNCEGDRLRNLFTTNGVAGPGVSRYVIVENCTMRNATNNAFSSHEEGEYIFFNGCVSIGGAENATGSSHGGGVGAGIQPRCPKVYINDFTAIGPHRAGLWTRQSGDSVRVNGLKVINNRWDAATSSWGVVLEGSNAIIRDLLVDTAVQEGLFVKGDNNDVEAQVVDCGNYEGNAALKFTGNAASSASAGATGNRIRMRVKDSPAAVAADTTSNGTPANNTVIVDELINTPIGATAWVQANVQSFSVVAASPRGTNVNIASPGSSLDGVTLATDNRILLKDQTTASQNGPWLWRGAATALIRPTDLLAKPFDTIRATVENGTENDSTSWELVTPNPIILGTTALRFTQASPSPSIPVSSKTGLRPFSPTSSILENMDRWKDSLSAQTIFSSGTIRVFPLGLLRAGQTATALNFYVAATGSGAPTNSWGGIATLNDRVVRAISATSTANPAGSSVLSFTFGTPYVPNNDVILIGFAMYQVTTAPTLYGIAHPAPAAVVLSSPIINGISNTVQTLPIANGATLNPFTAGVQVPYSWLT